MSQPSELPEPGTGNVVPLRPGENTTPPPPPGPDPPPQRIYADLTASRRRRIIPDQWRTWDNAKRYIRDTITELAHRTGYHAARLHWYFLLHTLWSPRGAYRITDRIVRWWHIPHASELEFRAARAGLINDHLRIHKASKETRKIRGIYIAAATAAVLLAGAAMWMLTPHWIWLPLAAAATFPLGRIGAPRNKPIIHKAALPAHVQPPTPDIITAALGSLGITGINQAIKDGGNLRFVTDVHRDGEGWRTDLDLPYGVTVKMILARRAEFASALRLPLSAVWPEGVPAEHPGRMILWIGYHDISKTKPKTWPLLRTGTADVFQPVPFGTDPRGRTITAGLFETNWLIGAAPGQGKTGTVRELACAAALDPLADLWIHEHSGKGDLEPLAKICYRYVSGLADESITYTAESLQILRAELGRRSAQFKKLPREARPDGRVTRELAAQKTLRLRPLICVIDEAHNVFMHPDLGKTAAADAAYVIRLGRAYGIILILSTQRPDKNSLPTTIRDVVTVRFCLKVPDQPSNDMILGTGAYSAGYNAAIFRARTDAGLGWLKGEDDPQIVRTYYLDLPATEKIAARARAMRERAGTLSGYALGEDPGDAGARDVPADVLACFTGEAALHWDVLATRLAQRFPGRWDGATAEAVSAECRARGVPSKNVTVGGETRKGCRKDEVEEAAARS